jgi:hypothetical protein
VLGVDVLGLSARCSVNYINRPFQTLSNLNLQHLTLLRETARDLQICVRRGIMAWNPGLNK